MFETKPMLKCQCAINILLKKLHILYLITSSQGYDVDIETSLCTMMAMTIMIDQVFFQIAHRYVLMNFPEVEPYLRRFTSQLHSAVPASNILQTIRKFILFFQ